MLNKKERTIDTYKRAGAMMRLYKTLGMKLVTELSEVLPAKETDRLLGILQKVDITCCRVEDCMFSDYPKLGHEYTDVFYGATNSEPRNELDAEIIKRAREAADALFK